MTQEKRCNNCLEVHDSYGNICNSCYNKGLFHIQDDYSNDINNKVMVDLVTSESTSSSNKVWILSKMLEFQKDEITKF